MTAIPCEFSGCDWKSPPGSLNTVVKFLEIHVNARHSTNRQNASAKPEKAKRPEIGAELSDEDWNYFLSRWSAYKKATNLTGEEITLQLMECCCEELRRNHHRNYPADTPVDEKTLLASPKLKRLQ